MQTSRLEEQFSVVASADTSCSVLWLLPADPAEIADAMAAITARSGLVARGFAGWWDQSPTWQARAGEIEGATVLRADMRVGATRMAGAMLDVRPGGVSWFWPEFAGRVRQRQICAALVPPEAAAPAGWAQAGLQLVLAAASLQVRPGPTHLQVLEVLAEAFIVETLAVSAVAITRVCPELLRPGMAVTASPPPSIRSSPYSRMPRLPIRARCNDPGISANAGRRAASSFMASASSAIRCVVSGHGPLRQVDLESQSPV